jgi:TonB family protein
MKRLSYLFLTLSFLLCSALAGAQGAFQIIVHEQNLTSSLSSDELSRLFLKKSRSWSDGAAVEPVDLVSTSPVRESFSLAIHGRSVASIKSFWQHKIFSGLSSPPLELSADDEVIAYVSEHRGAIGYVSAAARLDSASVKAISFVTEPVRTHYVEPDYTSEAEASNLSGSVRLRVEVDRRGRVGEIEVIEGLSMGLTEEAIKAVRQWRYEAATRNGTPVDAEINVAVTFKTRE